MLWVTVSFTCEVSSNRYTNLVSTLLQQERLLLNISESWNKKNIIIVKVCFCLFVSFKTKYLRLRSRVQFCIVYFTLVQISVEQYRTLHCSSGQQRAISFSALQWTAVYFIQSKIWQCRDVQCRAGEYSTLQYSAVQWIQCIAMQYTYSAMPSSVV